MGLRVGATTIPEIAGRVMVGDRVVREVRVGTTVVWRAQPFVFQFTGGVQSITLPRGLWRLECWGARGFHDNVGRLRGYASGVVQLLQQTTLFVYVGQEGHRVTSNGSLSGFRWNGGGRAWRPATALSSTRNGTGGGATDIRTVNGTWDNASNLRRRIIVAGGSGGVLSTGSSEANGGNGGGIRGLGWNGHGWSGQVSGGPGGGDFGFSQQSWSGIALSSSGAGGGWWAGRSVGAGQSGAGGSGYVHVRRTEWGNTTQSNVAPVASGPIHRGESGGTHNPFSDLGEAWLLSDTWLSIGGTTGNDRNNGGYVVHPIITQGGGNAGIARITFVDNV